MCEALDAGSTVVRDAALMLARDLAAAAQPSLVIPALPALLPRLLGAAAEQEAREVAAAADEALEALLARAPPQSCLGLLAPHLPAPGAPLPTGRGEGARLCAAIRCLRRVAARMQPAGLGAHLQPELVPGLCAAYNSPLSDVRKATVDCLVAIWQVRQGWECCLVAAAPACCRTGMRVLGCCRVLPCCPDWEPTPKGCCRPATHPPLCSPCRAPSCRWWARPCCARTWHP